MAASKLSPQERLNRKRNAARLRQQRCRARKRQALVELWKNRAMGPLIPKLEFTSSSDDSFQLPQLRPRTVSFDVDSISRSQASSFDSFSSSDESDCDRHSPIPSSIKLPNKEEAAVAAMLSLKTVSKRQEIFRPVPKIIRAPVVYPNRWNPMVFQSRRPRIMPMIYTNYMA